jgi:hypothetical protein
VYIHKEKVNLERLKNKHLVLHWLQTLRIRHYSGPYPLFQEIGTYISYRDRDPQAETRVRHEWVEPPRGNSKSRLPAMEQELDLGAARARSHGAIGCPGRFVPHQIGFQLEAFCPQNLLSDDWPALQVE